MWFSTIWLIRYGPVNIGMTVRLPVDDVDRPKLGHTHIFGVVMELKDGFYRIGTNWNLLNFTREINLIHAKIHFCHSMMSQILKQRFAPQLEPILLLEPRV